MRENHLIATVRLISIMLESIAAMIFGLMLLSTISGMLGLGVAFAAIPFLSIFFADLVRGIQPMALLLNGFTALFSAVGFSKSGFVDWRKAAPLAIVTTLSEPIGSILVLKVPQLYVWFIYFASVLYLAYRLFKPVKATASKERYKLALILAVPISILAGFLGVGPGFLLMPTLIIAGLEPKKAAGINAVAVCPPSFSALIPRLGNISMDLQLTAILLITSTIASYGGARITSKYVPSILLKKLFGLLIVVMTLYRIFSLVGF
ncbi:MAG: sulfite exporter TauE/SafE family protein [Fervidicoccaceae archaeon]